jgi:uncharacterized RmlC-like cupin family protein
MDSIRKEATCRVVSQAAPYVGKQALTYSVGISAQSVGSNAIHMQLVRIPPGARAKAHMHVDHETAIYALSGTSHVWHGEKLDEHSVVRPGEFFYIPAGVPHLPYNPSKTEEVVAVIARTDPNEQESVLLLPHLDTDAVKDADDPPRD